MKSNCEIIMTIELFAQTGPWSMCQTTHLKILVWWSFMTWPWPWPELNMKQLHYSVPSPMVLGSRYGNFGRKLLRLRTLRSATWIHPILTCDLTLSWHVTSILNFRAWFGSVSSRSFECRLAHLSTAIRFRDSRAGGGVGSDPPGCGGYRNSPGGGGLNKWSHMSTNRLINN